MTSDTRSHSPDAYESGTAPDSYAATLRENERLRAELSATQSALADLRERFALLAHASTDTDPRPRLREVAALGRKLREIEAEQVQAALARGFSYAEIAAELGVTRQSVHQKHPRRNDHD